MTLGDAFGPGERRPQLRGVSGWLLFLCIVLMVFLPLRLALFLWVIVTSPASLGLQSFFLVLIIVPLVIGIIAGVLLYREQRLGLRLAQLFFGLQLLVAIAALVADPSRLPDLILGIVPAAAWLAYLFRSERVRNTYAENTAREAADVFR